MNICVFCASSEAIDKEYLKAGEELGERLAREGHTLVFGAGKYGIMGAVVRGLRREDGKAVGVIPRFFDSFDVMYTDCEIIKTDTMRERKRIMEEMSDAFIMMPGGIGTFEEFFEVLTLKQLGRHTKPIVIYNVNGYYDRLTAFIKQSVSEGFISMDAIRVCSISGNLDDVFEIIKVPGKAFNKYHILEGGYGEEQL